MTKNMFHALPGIFATGFFFVAFILSRPTLSALLTGLLGLAALCYTIVYLGAEADYWRKRSYEFYTAQQNLIDAGIVKWDDPILRPGRART